MFEVSGHMYFNYPPSYMYPCKVFLLPGARAIFVQGGARGWEMVVGGFNLTLLCIE